MNDPSAQRLLAHAEPLVAISIAHLHPATRQRLADDALSVIAYPNDYGGFVHVGNADSALPPEPELAALIRTARTEDIVWIKFDADAPVAEGFPAFDDSEPAP